MKRSYSTFLRSLLCVAVLAVSASAEEVKNENGPTEGPPSEVVPAANCNLQGYKSEVVTFTAPIPIPDNVAAGVTIGPIVIPDDGSLIADVVIDLSLVHTWSGDLIATVGYDANCDGAIDASSVIICRPGRTISCGAAGSGFGCSSNFICANTLLFDDTAAAGLPTTGCLTATNIAPGCYRPTGLGVGTLAVFDNLRKGGCWYLNISDNAAADTGNICGWSVHILNQTVVGVESVTWSATKNLYKN